MIFSSFLAVLFYGASTLISVSFFFSLSQPDIWVYKSQFTCVSLPVYLFVWVSPHPPAL